MPLTITPRAIPEPKTAYDKTLISLAISPIILETGIEAAMSMRLVPYRVLSDGSIESREDMAQTINSGAVFAEAQTDPALAMAASQIWDALQGYLSAKGI
jgi:hypothetical protein